MFRSTGWPAYAASLALAVLALGSPLASVAQDLPSYARPAAASADETVHGRIRSVDGAFRITVDDDRGFVDEVRLRPGTIINPTGLTLASGMSVTILGYNAGTDFDANEIDTPYTYDGPLPEPYYYGAGYWYPGFAYGYGPAFGLSLVFGSGYGAWSFAHRPFWGRPWNGHGYFGSYVGVGPLEHGVSHLPPAFVGRTFPGERYPTAVERGSDPENTPSRTYAHASAPDYGGERAGPQRGYSRAGSAAGSTRGAPTSGRSAPAGHGGGGRPHR
jgi:hypothetical protein